MICTARKGFGVGSLTESRTKWTTVLAYILVRWSWPRRAASCRASL